jgi:hypothetical protein
MTQRYKFVNDYGFCGCSEVEDDEGEFVQYAEYKKLLTTIERIRALHKPYAHPDLKMTVCDFDGYPYPCRELRILDETNT